MKVLVIGGTRFVGLRLVRYLSEQGYDITILNRGQTQAVLPPGVKRLYADRRNPEEIRRALTGRQFEIVFDITGYEVRNLEPVVEFLTGKIGQYVFQSTAGVYAESRYLPVLEDFPRISGTVPEKGLAAYEANKVQCEDYLLRKYQEAGFPVTILRCPVIYGPENWMHDREFSYFVRLLQLRPVLIPGNGQTILHFTYVDDIARAHSSVIGKKSVVGKAFNIAGAEAITIEGYIDTIAEILGVTAKKIYLDFTVMKNIKKSIFPFGWRKSSLYGIYQAKESCSFWPAFSMTEGLKNTYQWWQQNPGITGTRFEPGRLGYNVDLAYEDEIIRQYG